MGFASTANRSSLRAVRAASAEPSRTVLRRTERACVCWIFIPKQARQTVQEILDGGGEASAHECDVTNQEEVRAVFQELAQRGGIDTLVNNAGISHVGKLESTTERDFDRVFQVNVKGIYHCMLAAVAHMKVNGGGVILNMASIAGSSGLADRFAYSTSKGAVIAMTYSVARDYLACNIRCNCISPARVHTPL